jgi:hypothetical protein
LHPTLYVSNGCRNDRLSRTTTRLPKRKLLHGRRLRVCSIWRIISRPVVDYSCYGSCLDNRNLVVVHQQHRPLCVEGLAAHGPCWQRLPTAIGVPRVQSAEFIYAISVCDPLLLLVLANLRSLKDTHNSIQLPPILLGRAAYHNLLKQLAGILIRLGGALEVLCIVE